MTNYERVKSMNIEEMATFICDLIYIANGETCNGCTFEETCNLKQNGVQHFLESEVLKYDK